MFSKFVDSINNHACKVLVVDIRKTFNMDEINDDHNMFKNYKKALYACDVRFQQCNRPSGTMAEGKLHYSGKHHLYGIKL